MRDPGLRFRGPCRRRTGSGHATHHRPRGDRPPSPDSKKPRPDHLAAALIRPKIDIGCTPAQWADFLRQWSRFSVGCNIVDVQLTTQCMACFSDELVSTADKAIQDMGTLAVDALLTQVKSVAVQPVAVGILRATAHSAKQAAGERFQTFAAKVRGLTTHCNYILPCPHAPPAAPGTPAVRACAVANCMGTDYTSAIIKNILLSGIHDHNVCREVLGTVGVEEKSVHEIIRMVKGKEAARDAASNAKPAAAAATTSSYKKAPRQDANARPPQPTRQSASPPDGDRQPRRLRCRCGNEFDDYALRRNGTYNLYPYEACHSCFLSKKPAKGRKSMTATGPGFDNQSPTREVRVSSARVTHANVMLCGHTEGHSSHPRLEVLLLFATPNGRKEFRAKDAVADSGAQITIVPAGILSQEGIAITGLRRSMIDQRAANNVKMEVLGVADASISALSPSGERFSTTTAAYVVKNVDEVFLSLEVMVGLRIVDEQFPTAGAGNQHGAQKGAWDRTGTVTECLPHKSYCLLVDGSGRISQRTRQHLRQFIPNDVLHSRDEGRATSAPTARPSQAPASQDATLPATPPARRGPTTPPSTPPRTPPGSCPDSPIEVNTAPDCYGEHFLATLDHTYVTNTTSATTTPKQSKNVTNRRRGCRDAHS